MEKDNKYTREGDRRFTLRIEQSLFEKIEASARACKRSIGRQIEYILDYVLNNQNNEEDSLFLESLKFPKKEISPRVDDSKSA